YRHITLSATGGRAGTGPVWLFLSPPSASWQIWYGALTRKRPAPGRRLAGGAKMSPHTTAYLAAIGGGAGAAALWCAARLTLLGGAMPGAFEVITAVMVGFLGLGVVAAVREARANERDQTDALRRLCREMGFTFTAGAQEGGPALLRPYTAALHR